MARYATQNLTGLGKGSINPSRLRPQGARGKTRPDPRGVKSPAVPPIALKPKAAALVHSLAEKLRITPEEFVTIAARKAEREIEETGGWTISATLPADPVATAWETINRPIEATSGGGDSVTELMLGGKPLSLPDALRRVGFRSSKTAAGKTRNPRRKEKDASATGLKAADLVSHKTAQRMAELDKKLKLRGKDRVAEAILEATLRDLKEGDTGIIMNGWTFDDADEAKADLLAMGTRWAREDRKASAKGKEGKAP